MQQEQEKEKEKEPLVLDGSSGGGQFLRIAFALAALAQQPVRVINVCGKASPPGLQQPLLQGLRALAKVCNGRLEGDSIGSRECAMYPSQHIKDGQFIIDTEPGSSCTFLAGMALPSLLFMTAPGNFTIKGATDCEGWCPIDEMCGVLMPTLIKFGVELSSVQVQLNKRGFVPLGGGEVNVALDATLYNSGLQAVKMLDQGKLAKVKGRAYAMGPQEVEDMAKMVAAAKEFLNTLVPSVTVQITEVEETPETAAGNACGMTLVAITDTNCRYGATYFRAPGDPLPPDECGRKAVEMLANEVRIGGCVDTRTQDQLIPFMALADGRSEIRVGSLTADTKVAIAATQALLPCRISIAPDGDTNIICCDGVRLLGAGRFFTPSADPTKSASRLAALPACIIPTPEDNLPETILAGYGGRPAIVQATETLQSVLSSMGGGIRDYAGDDGAMERFAEEPSSYRDARDSHEEEASNNVPAPEYEPDPESGPPRSAFGSVFQNLVEVPATGEDGEPQFPRSSSPPPEPGTDSAAPSFSSGQQQQQPWHLLVQQQQQELWQRQQLEHQPLSGANQQPAQSTQQSAFSRAVLQSGPTEGAQQNPFGGSNGNASAFGGAANPFAAQPKGSFGGSLTSPDPFADSSVFSRDRESDRLHRRRDRFRDADRDDFDRDDRDRHRGKALWVAESGNNGSSPFSAPAAPSHSAFSPPSSTPNGGFPASAASAFASPPSPFLPTPTMPVVPSPYQGAPPGMGMPMGAPIPGFMAPSMPMPMAMAMQMQQQIMPGMLQAPGGLWSTGPGLSEGEMQMD
eukprot:GGOE01019061.1.p1 GENE.GGOE01019061.1~~GGOE01019061.1.p1  ORF type:complete len:820 (-),score=164.14 GGOE01019061.1:208-2607(-)